MKVLKNLDSLEKHLNNDPDHCVFLHTSNCLIFCYECDMEIKDAESDPYKDNKRTDCLELRKLFANKLDTDDTIVIQKGVKSVNIKLAKFDLFPVLSILNSLICLYSIDYIRKLLKKKSLTSQYCLSSYGVKLFPSFVSNLCDSIFYLGRENTNPLVIEKLYFSLIKEDPSISSYSYQNLHVI